MMKPNKYDALEFCRRTIKSCTTLKQMHTAYNLVFNFNVMFDDLFCDSLLEDEWRLKYEEICKQNGGYK